MPRSLPADVLGIIANYSEKPTLAVLVRVSSTVRAISLRPLYTSIEVVGSGSMTQCLVTLAENTDIAALVQELRISCGSMIPRELSEIAARALEQVVNLTTLWLTLPYNWATSKILVRARFRLRDFTCDLKSDPEYPIAQFLESQPGLISLFLSRHCQSLLGLEASALPALSTLFGPLSILRDILPGRIDRMKRIGCQNKSGSSGPVNDIREFTEVLRGAQIKPDSNAPISVLIGVELGSSDATSAIETALSGLGDQAPWIGSLGIIIFGHANQVSSSGVFVTRLCF
ncbi:hypothetical protein RhiLY_04747 [Ceratobasidium sp. AG-Ba]|nr:hypothetical protein RhiLY_04747 [Ceratobasidium sp. AG-Ba]